MITISAAGKKKLSELEKDKIFVVADFDRTITTINSNPTFSLYSLCGLYGSEYDRERMAVHNHFRPIELDTSIPYEEKFELMKEWAIISYNLMIKYKVRESDVARIVKEKKLLELRSGAIEFINTLNRLGIPLVINSAGIGNFIEYVLRLNNCYSDNIFISANFLSFKDDIVVDSIKDIIHSMNKYDIRLSEEYRESLMDKRVGIVIGDQLSDLNMDHNLPNEETLSFGFLEANVEENEELFNRQFDVVLKDNEGFESVGKLLRLK